MMKSPYGTHGVACSDVTIIGDSVTPASNFVLEKCSGTVVTNNLKQETRTRKQQPNRLHRGGVRWQRRWRSLWRGRWRRQWNRRQWRWLMRWAGRPSPDEEGERTQWQTKTQQTNRSQERGGGAVVTAVTMMTITTTTMKPRSDCGCGGGAQRRTWL